VNFCVLSMSLIAVLLQNLDLTANNRKLLHEGPLAWRIQHSKRAIGMCSYVCVCCVSLNVSAYVHVRACLSVCEFACSKLIYNTISIQTYEQYC